MFLGTVSLGVIWVASPTICTLRDAHVAPRVSM